MSNRMELKVKSSIETLNAIISGLDTHKKFYYTRFGDGEILSMMGKNHRNYNFSIGLKNELVECFTIDHPQFLLASAINIKKEKGMSQGLFAAFGKNKELEDYVLTNNIFNSTGLYENYVAFHYLTVTRPKLIYNFFEKYIRPKKKMFIGCTPKEVAEKLYGKIDFYVNVPSKHAYDTINDWWPDIENNVDRVEMVIPSAGAASNVISKRLWKLNKEIHLLDIGSIIDAVEGRVTRTWIRLQGHKVNKILPERYREKRLSKKILFGLKNIKCYFRSLTK